MTNYDTSSRFPDNSKERPTAGRASRIVEAIRARAIERMVTRASALEIREETLFRDGFSVSISRSDDGLTTIIDTKFQPSQPDYTGTQLGHNEALVQTSRLSFTPGAVGIPSHVTVEKYYDGDPLLEPYSSLRMYDESVHGGRRSPDGLGPSDVRNGLKAVESHLATLPPQAADGSTS